VLVEQTIAAPAGLQSARTALEPVVQIVERPDDRRDVVSTARAQAPREVALGDALERADDESQPRRHERVQTDGARQARQGHGDAEPPRCRRSARRLPTS
jgi:hypothetical protein